MASTYGASRSHTLDTPHSVGLLWTSDQPDAQTSTWQHTQSQETDIHVPGGIRTRNPIKPAAADPRLGRRGQMNRRCTNMHTIFTVSRDVWVRCCWTISLLLASCSSSCTKCAPRSCYVLRIILLHLLLSIPLHIPNYFWCQFTECQISITLCIFTSVLHIAIYPLLPLLLDYVKNTHVLSTIVQMLDVITSYRSSCKRVILL
jgi:hypothetical protein